MAPYRELFVSRSDGRLNVKAKGKAMEPNEPTPAQLDSTPSASGVTDFYKEVLPGEAKELEWRRKLGGMLHRALATPDQKDQLWILARLPDNYRLFEHLKFSKSETGEQQKSSRTHARGGNDRQDAYLYGHPAGRKKRYRCPADFFNHLLWLATDKDGDPDNCTCVICCPDELPRPESVDNVRVAVPSKEVQSREAASSLKSSAPSQTPVSKISTLPPPPPLKEQEFDTRYKSLIYRIGEVVWFSRGPSWGLALIVHRAFHDAAGRPQKPSYFLQPLSHPLQHPKFVVVDDQDQLRPWLAWSAPPLTIEPLEGKTYDMVDWEGAVRGIYGHGVPEVDGSILAAKRTDESFTTFGDVSLANAEPGLKAWRGIYVGGERIWTGEAIRLATTAYENQTEILVLKTILESPNKIKPTTNSQTSEISLYGDHYMYTYHKGEPKPANEALPLRVQKDLEYRNSFVRPGSGEAAYWKLLKRDARVGIESVKGRWYESELLLPTLQAAAELAKDQQSGLIKDVGQFMNRRCDRMLPGDRIGVRTKTRAEAFGRSVPGDIIISLGLDELPRESNQVGRPRDVVDAGRPGPGAAGGGAGQGDAIQQFVNLD